MTRPVALIVVSELGSVDPTVTTVVVERADEIRWLGAYAFRRRLPLDDVDLVLIDVDRGLDEAAALAVQLLERPAHPADQAPDPGPPPAEPPPRPAEDPSTVARPRVAFLAATLSTRIRAMARTCGVEALVAKSLTVDELTNALVTAAHGLRVDAPGRPAGTSSWPGQVEGLTQREGEVLELCAAGFTNREIADRLYLNVETVKSHLKRVYQRLGLRNRAEAAAYVHRQGGGRGAAGISDQARTVTNAERLPPLRLGDELGLTADVLAERRHLLNLTDAAASRLTPFAGAVEAGTDAFVSRLIDRWLACEHTAHLLYNEAATARLAEHQRRYLADLFRGDTTEAHVEAMLRTGAVHHRLGLTPQWYLASYVHVVCDHLPLLFAEAPSPLAAVDAVGTLVARVLFDASLGLDAYELSVEREVRGVQRSTSAPGPTANGGGGGGGDPADTPHSTRPGPDSLRAVTRITVITDESQTRRAFLEIDDDTIAALHQLAPLIERATPAMLGEFYAVLGGIPSVAELVPPSIIPRLLSRVADHWHHLVRSPFDRHQAEACVRVGLVHERIGLTPQLYLTGLARQVNSLLHTLVAPADGRGPAVDPTDLPAATDALLRAIFFDLTFVLDAYLDARIDTLLDGQRFADQIVANLATGVAVVDARGRLEYVNERLLSYVRQPVRTLRRLPLEHAIDLDGLNQLVAAARASISGRSSALVRHRDRQLRVTAACLHRTVSGDTGPVAIIVDDLSEVVRIGTEAELDDRHLANVLATVSAVAWEIDQESLVVVAVSRAVESLTGHRDVDLLGRAYLAAVLTDGTGQPGDAAALLSRIKRLRPGQRVELEHRLRTADDRYLDARSSVVAGTGASGRPTLFGVTVPVVEPDPHPDPV